MVFSSNHQKSMPVANHHHFSSSPWDLIFNKKRGTRDKNHERFIVGYFLSFRAFRTLLFQSPLSPLVSFLSWRKNVKEKFKATHRSCREFPSECNTFQSTYCDPMKSHMVKDCLIYECVGHMALSLPYQDFVGHVICSPSTWSRNYSSNFHLWQKRKMLLVTSLQLNLDTCLHCLHWPLKPHPGLFLAGKQTGPNKYWRTEGFHHHFITPSTTEWPPPFPAFLSALSPGEFHHSSNMVAGCHNKMNMTLLINYWGFWHSTLEIVITPKIGLQLDQVI